MDAMDDMRHVFEEAGLIAPPVPIGLRPRIRRQADWVFATRDVDPMAMYLFSDYLLEAVAQPIDDHMAVSHAGHGINSYGLSYNLVYGPVAIFTQTGWGGVYMDKDESAAEVGRQFRQCAELIDAIEATEQRQSSSRRLIVVESTFRGMAACEWLASPLGDERAALEWLGQAMHDRDPQASPLETAIQLVRSS